MPEPSIFSRIIAREIPQEFIYEDDHCVVIPTLEPITPGHCLVIPKEQVDHLWDLDNPTYLHLQFVAKEVAQKMRAEYDYARIGSMVEGFGVPHAHIHIFGLTDPIETTIPDHIAHKYTATPEELKDTAVKLRFS